MGDFFTTSVLVATAASAVRLATPYLLAALGETIGQRSGVLNLGVDGVMMLSAFFAYWTVLETRNLWLGVLVALLVGLIMGALYGVITVFFEATQGISGIGIFIFGLGFSDLLFRQQVGTPKPIRRLPNLDVPFVRHSLYRRTSFPTKPSNLHCFFACTGNRDRSKQNNFRFERPLCR